MNEHCNLKTCCFHGYIPARYILTFLTFLGMSIEFAHRVCLSVTIVVMVNHTALSDESRASQADQNSCPVPGENITVDVDDKGKFIWHPATQGVILGAYFYGFLFTQPLGGRLADIFGGKWILGLAILSASLLTLITPEAADAGIAPIVVLRIAMGLVHGVCLPSVFAIFSQWEPENERNSLVMMCLVGDHVGTALSMPLAGYLCSHGFAGGWPSVFYVLGTAGCLWFLCWWFLGYSLPIDYHRISKDELRYINEGKLHTSQKTFVPWRDILSSKPVWSIAVVAFSAAWGQTTLLTKLPMYMETILKMPIKRNGLVNSLVYVSSCATLFCSGYFSDFLIKKNILSPTKVRKSFQVVAMIGPATCTALIPFVGCDKTWAIILLTAAMAFLGLCGGGYVSTAVDISPNYAGAIFSLVNIIGCIAGILSPLTAGLILEYGHNRLEHWNLVFYVSSTTYIFGAVVFTTLASAEVQPWNAKLISLNFEEEKLSKESHAINHRKEFEASFKYGAVS